LAFASFLELDVLGVLVVDVGVSFEVAIGWLHFDFAGVTLASQVELDHGDAQELGVAADVCGHWNFEIFVVVCNSEGF